MTGYSPTPATRVSTAGRISPKSLPPTWLLFGYRCMVAVAVTIVITSCSSGSSGRIKEIALPASAVQLSKPLWGVVVQPFIRIREKPDPVATPVGTVWRGHIVELRRHTAQSYRIGEHQGYWYRAHRWGVEGWVFGGYITTASSLEEARWFARQERTAPSTK